MIAAIYASDYIGGIGLQGNIPWLCHSDTKRFWATVGDDPIVVGSKTWERLEPIAKKHRHDNAVTYVLSRNFWDKKASNVVSVSVNGVIKMNARHPEKLYWICGGAQTYNAFFEANAIDFVIATTILDCYFTDVKLFPDSKNFDHRHLEGFTQILPIKMFRYSEEPSYEIRVWANTKRLREGVINKNKFLSACHFDYQFGEN